MTLKMTTAQVVETSVTVTNSSFQNYAHPDDHTTRNTLLSCENLKARKKNEYKRTKDSYLLTFSTHCENKPLEVGAEPRQLRAKCTTSNGNKTSLPGAVAVLKTLGAKGPYSDRCGIARCRAKLNSREWDLAYFRPSSILQGLVLLFKVIEKGLIERGLKRKRG